MEVYRGGMGLAVVKLNKVYHSESTILGLQCTVTLPGRGKRKMEIKEAHTGGAEG